MKRSIFTLLLLSVAIFCFGQKTDYVRTRNTNNIIVDANLKSSVSFLVPRDSTASLRGAPDSAGYLKFNPSTKTFQGYYGTALGWKDIGGASTYSWDIVLNGTSLGPYNSGDHFTVNNANLQQIFTQLSTKVIHPTYVAPTASISSTPSAGSYEYGTNLGTITLSSSFNQNDGGAIGATTYYKNGTALGGNTDVVTTLTSTVSYYVNKTYSAGACKTNNLGQVDCTGQIQAGSVNSGSITFSSYHKRYLGFASSALNSDGTPTDADVQAAMYKDNSGTSASTSQTLAQQSSDKYLFFVTTVPVTSITINGFPSTASFNMNISRTFVNAAGGSYTYYFCVSKNAIGSTGTTSFTSN